MDPVGTLLSLAHNSQRTPMKQADPMSPSSTLYTKLRDIILATQYASESQNSIDFSSRSVLPGFPQTALAKLRSLLDTFPPPPRLTPTQLTKVVLAVHPGLLHAQFVAWAMLSRQTEEAGLGPLGSPSLNGEDDGVGFLGYGLLKVGRVDETSVHMTFSQKSMPPIEVVAPAGPRKPLEFPWKDPSSLGFMATNRFIGLLTSMVQAHVLGWDIALIPPVLPSTASCSTSSLVRAFGELLGYEIDSVHLYKELGGRELVMRRRVGDDGATTWEPR